MIQKIAAFFDKVWDWAVYSSANPDKISSTIKWGAGIIGTLLTVTLGFGHITFPDAQWTQNVDAFIQIVQEIALIITTVGTAAAGLRKVWTSLSGMFSPSN